MMTLVFGCISFLDEDELEREAVENKEMSFLCKTVLSSGIEGVSIVPLEKENDSVAVKSILSSDFDSGLFEKYGLKSLTETNASNVAETWYFLTQAKSAFYDVEEECEADQLDYDRVFSAVYRFYEIVSDSFDSFDYSVEGMSEMVLSVQERLDLAGADDPNYSAEIFKKFNKTEESINALKEFHSAVGNSRRMKDVINSVDKEQPFSSLLWVQYFFITTSGLSKLSGKSNLSTVFDLVVPLYSDIASYSRSELEEQILAGERPKIYHLGSAIKKGVGLKSDGFLKSSFSFTVSSLRILENMKSEHIELLADLEKRTLETKNTHLRFKSENFFEINDVVLARLNELLGKNNDWFEASNTLFTSPKELLETFEEEILEIDVLKKKSEKSYLLKQDNYLSSSIIDLRLALRKVLVLKKSQEEVVFDMENIEAKARQAYEIRVVELERLIEELSFEKSNGIDETNNWLIKFAEKELRRQKENVDGSKSSSLGLRVKIWVDSAVEIERVKKIVLDPSTSSLNEVEDTARFVKEVKQYLIALESSKEKKEPLFELLYSAESAIKKAKLSAGNGDLESASRKALEARSIAGRLFELIKIEFELVSRPVFEKHKRLRVSIKSIDKDMFEELLEAIDLSDKIQEYVALNSKSFDLSAIGKISKIQNDLLEIESVLKKLKTKSSEVISFNTRKKWVFLTRPFVGEVVDSKLMLFYSNPFGLVENVLLSVDSPNPYSQISNESIKDCTQIPSKTYFLNNKLSLFFEKLDKGSHSCLIDFSFVPAVLESEKYLVERATNELADIKLLFDINAKDDFEELWIKTNFDLSDLTEASFEKSVFEKKTYEIKISGIKKGLQSRILKTKLNNPILLKFSDPKINSDKGDCVETSIEILLINDTDFDLKDISVHFDLPYSGVQKASLNSFSVITGFNYFGTNSNNVFFVLKSISAHSVSKAEYSFCFDSTNQAKENNLDELEEKINDLKGDLPETNLLFDDFDAKINELRKNYVKMNNAEFAVAIQSISTDIDETKNSVLDLNKLSLEYKVLSKRFIEIRSNIESFEISEEFSQDLLFADNEFARSKSMFLSKDVVGAIEVLEHVLELIEGSEEFKSQNTNLIKDFQVLFQNASNLRSVFDLLENPSSETISAMSNLNRLMEEFPNFFNSSKSKTFFREMENSLIESKSYVEKDVDVQMNVFDKNFNFVVENIVILKDKSSIMSKLVKPALEEEIIEKVINTGFSFLVSESAVKKAQVKDTSFEKKIELIKADCLKKEHSIDLFVKFVENDCLSRFENFENELELEIKKRALLIDRAREVSESELSLALVELSEKEVLATNSSSVKNQLNESRDLLVDSKNFFEKEEFSTSAFLSRYVRTGMVVLIPESENDGFNFVPWILFALLFLFFGVYWFKFKKSEEKPVEKKKVPRKIFS